MSQGLDTKLVDIVNDLTVGDLIQMVLGYCIGALIFVCCLGLGIFLYHKWQINKLK